MNWSPIIRPGIHIAPRMDPATHLFHMLDLKILSMQQMPDIHTIPYSNQRSRSSRFS